MNTTRIGVCVFACSFAACLGSAQAVLINPNQFRLLPGTTLAIEPQLAGNVIADDSVSFSYFDDVSRGTISGAIQSTVLRSNVDGTLDFYWQITNDADSTGPLKFVSLHHFDAPEYNANWRIDSAGDVALERAARFCCGEISTFVNFVFSDASLLQPGQSSKLMFFDTSATAYAKTATMNVAAPFPTNTFSANVPTFSPTLVPEPSTLAMLLAALPLGYLAYRRR